MSRASTLLLSSVLMLAGCGSDDDGSSLTAERSGACVAPIPEAPGWKNARTDASAIRVVTRDDVRSKLTAELLAYLERSDPELAAQSRDRVVSLIVDGAHVDSWVEPGTCKTWKSAVVNKETVANEVVFLRLNEQFARDIPRFRELGGDAGKSDEQRSGYLTTALLLLESIDARYLSRNLAVNYERELIQSRLDEIVETSSVDFLALLDQGLKSTSVKVAERTRLSLEKFESIDQALRSDGLKRMDRLIAGLRSQSLRAEIDEIGQKGLAGDYEQAEAASVALARFSDGKEASYSQAIVLELNERARTLRTKEIESALNELQGSIASKSTLQELSARVDALASTHGETPEQTGWRERLASMLEGVQEMEAFAARRDCSTMADLDSFTKFQFGDTDFEFSNRKTRRLIVEKTSSEISIANQVNRPIRILGVTQQITGEDGVVISNGSLAVPTEIAGAESFTTSIDLKFDNEHPAAKACLEPLARRTHECWIHVVTSVQVEGRYACPQTIVSLTERVRFESQHLPDNYTIKLRRPQNTPPDKS